MRPKSEMLTVVTGWSDSDRSGNLVLFQPPRSEVFDAFVEETIKLHEMTETEKSVALAMFDKFDATKIEMFRSKEGNPDRIRVTRKP